MILTIELPFYIDAPGGLIDISKRIEVTNQQQIKGSFNLAYVSEFKATIPTYLWSLVDKDWDILKKEEVISNNETEELSDYRNHLLLEEANQNAIFVGFNLADKYVSITNAKIHVAFINPEAKTSLKIGDEIIKIDNKTISSKKDISDIIASHNEGDTVYFTTSNNETKEGTVILKDNKKIIGLVLTEIKELDTNENVNFKFKPSESGPSGGFMMALSIYNYLIDIDLTHGLKIVGTGTIDEDGNVGEIGGIEYKIKGAVKEKADIFFAPSGDNYKDALKIVKENNYDIKLIEVQHIDDAIKYLNGI